MEEGTVGWKRIRGECSPPHPTGGLTWPAAGATAAPDPPGVPSGCRSRYSAQSPTLGRRTRAANTSATACRSRFSFRLIGAGQPRRAPPAPPHHPQLRASARPPGGGSSWARRSSRGAGPAPTPRHFRRSPAGEPGSATAPPPRGGRGRHRRPSARPSRAPHATFPRGGCRARWAAGPGLSPLFLVLPGATVSRGHPLPPLGQRWCGPLLGGSPARGSFAKVPELASWALTGAGWAPVSLRVLERARGPQSPAWQPLLRTPAESLPTPRGYANRARPDAPRLQPPRLSLLTRPGSAARTCGPALTPGTQYSPA